MAMASCAADSFIRGTQVGDGFNLVRRGNWRTEPKRVIEPEISPIGVYAADWWSRPTELLEAMEQLRNYVSILDQRKAQKVASVKTA